MDHLDRLEAQSVYILREAYRSFPNLAMLWSIGKDSTVLLWLTRKAFFGHVPYPLVHIDTGYALTSGANNTILGESVASTTLSTGSRNILIGTSSLVDTPAAGTNDWLNIGLS